MFIITTATINNPGSNELTSYNHSDEYKRTNNNNNNNNNSFKFGKDNQFSLKHFLEELTQNSSRFQINWQPLCIKCFRLGWVILQIKIRYRKFSTENLFFWLHDDSMIYCFATFRAKILHTIFQQLVYLIKHYTTQQNNRFNTGDHVVGEEAWKIWNWKFTEKLANIFERSWNVFMSVYHRVGQ